jgi:hypothetical protein
VESPSGAEKSLLGHRKGERTGAATEQEDFTRLMHIFVCHLLLSRVPPIKGKQAAIDPAQLSSSQPHSSFPPCTRVDESECEDGWIGGKDGEEGQGVRPSSP